MKKSDNDYFVRDSRRQFPTTVVVELTSEALESLKQTQLQVGIPGHVLTYTKALEQPPNELHDYFPMDNYSCVARNEN